MNNLFDDMWVFVCGHYRAKIIRSGISLDQISRLRKTPIISTGRITPTCDPTS